jgi:hypothetical protein
MRWRGVLRVSVRIEQETFSSPTDIESITNVGRQVKY